MDASNDSDSVADVTLVEERDNIGCESHDEFLSVTEEMQRYTFIDDAYIPEGHSVPSTPIASPVKPSPKKGRRGRKRKQSENESPSSQVPVTTKKKKKGVSKTAVFNIDEDEVAEPPLQSITAHLHLETTVEVPGRPGRGKSALTSVRLRQCNPFIFTVKDTYNIFVDAVADAADTMSWHLAMSHLRWRFETPVNLQPKLLANEVGYTAMITAVKSCRKDQVIFLYIPEPVSREKPTIDVSSKGKYSTSVTQEVDDISSQSSSLKSQINWLQNRAGGELQQLEEKYPVGNHLCFPNKRIYASDGLYWELTQLHLQVWANAIAAKPPTATYEEPPASNHFTKASAIPASQIPKDCSASQPSGVTEGHQNGFAPYGNTFQGHPPQAPYPYFPYPPPPQMPYGPYGYYMPHMPHPPTPTPQPPPAQAAAGLSSPDVTMSHNVSLSEFCTKYRLSVHTQEKLLELDYSPGNKVIETLTEVDWKETGLSILASRSFMAAHQNFCELIRTGKWNQ